MVNGDYRSNPFHGGGDFNGGWRWTHPYLCRVPAISGMRRNHGDPPMCLIARNCPAKWHDVGLGGMIATWESVVRLNWGGMYGGGWQYWPGWIWFHYRICCLAPKV